MPISPLVLVLFLSAIGLCALLWSIEWAAELNDLRRYPMPGRLAAINGHRIHVVEKGMSGPAVILESGLAATSLSWFFALPLLADFAQVMAYDRAGLGHSSPSNARLALPALLSDLDALIKNLPVTTPVILVGHSFGGLLMQAFAHRYPQYVAGLLLLDPVSLVTYAKPDAHYRRRLHLAVRLSKRGALLARFGIVRAALALVASGSRKLPAFIGRISAGRGSPVMDRLAGQVAKLPPEAHGPIRAHWSKPASFRLMAQYLSVLSAAAAEAQAMPVSPQLPVIILSAATATAAELAERDASVQNRPGSRHAQIPATTHWLQLDRPDLVVQAVRELIEFDKATHETTK